MNRDSRIPVAFATTAVLVIPTAGWADIPDESGPIPDPSLRWEAGITPLAGVASVDDEVHGALGVRLHGGIERDRFGLFTDLELVKLERSCYGDCVPNPEEAPGGLLRYALAGRVSIVRGKVVHGGHHLRSRIERMELMLDASVGLEAVVIDGEVIRMRPDIGAGLTWQVTNRAGHPSGGLRASVQFARPFDDAGEPSPARASIDPAIFIGGVLSFGD